MKRLKNGVSDTRNKSAYRGRPTLELVNFGVRLYRGALQNLDKSVKAAKARRKITEQFRLLSMDG
jgi:hypothetical protein